ncbi:MAG: carboxypeptidase-like regulatory domain-containing protein [Acidobacteriota bacterium]
MRVSLLAVLLPCLACSMAAQETRGRISGTVTDAQAAAVVGATVVVTNTGTNVARRLVTNTSGYYEAPPLLHGNYQVTVEAAGFTKAVRSGLTLAMSEQLRIDFQLEIGALSESITVSTESPILDTSTVTTGKVVTQRELRDLPVMTNDIVTLARVVPGVVNQGTTQYLSRGMVAEFKVETSNFDASFGHALGLNVSFASKAGTNEPHGTATEQYWNQRWNANPFFVKQNYYRQIAEARAAGNRALADKLRSQPMRAGGHSNNHGATITAPVYIPKVLDGRNKLFFFFAFSQAKDRQPARPGELNFTVPTMAQRQGDFSRPSPGTSSPRAVSLAGRSTISTPSASPFRTTIPPIPPWSRGTTTSPRACPTT